MATFKYDEITSIHYEIHGSGSHAIIFVHGFGDTGETWHKILPLIKQDCRLIVPDLRGFGLSSKPKDDRYTIDDQVRVLLALIHDQGSQGVSLVGHSLGGAIALRLALELVSDNTGLLDKLVLIDAASFPQQIPGFVRIPSLPFMGPAIIYCVPAHLQAFVSIRPLYITPHTYKASRARRYKASTRSQGGVHALVETARAIIADRESKWQSEISGLTCKTFVIWGSDDPAIPVAHAHRLHKEISGSQLFVVPSCGHVPHEEQPHLIGPLLSTFFTTRG